MKPIEEISYQTRIVDRNNHSALTDEEEQKRNLQPKTKSEAKKIKSQRKSSRSMELEKHLVPGRRDERAEGERGADASTALLCLLHPRISDDVRCPGGDQALSMCRLIHGTACRIGAATETGKVVWSSLRWLRALRTAAVTASRV